MKLIYKEIIFLFLIVIFCVAIVPKTFQNDTFFTIAVGEKILRQGIYTDEDFTWHEGLKYQNVRWIFDILISKINECFGFTGIYAFVILVTCLIGITIFTFLLKQKNNVYLSFILTIVTIYFSEGVFAARAQILSFLIFILEYYFIYKISDTGEKKYSIIVVLLSILLANTHASVFPLLFVFFLPYFANFILSKIIKKDGEDVKIEITNEKYILQIFITMILSIFGGLVSPLGYAPYVNMFKTVNEISSDIIGEMRNVVPVIDYYYTIVVVVIFGIIGFSKTKVKLVDALYLLGFGILPLSTYRSIFFFFLIGVFPLARLITSFFDNYSFSIKINYKQDCFFLVVVSIFIICFCLRNFTVQLKDNYVDSKSYPIDASNYIINNIDYKNMKLFNHFNYGSYLEYRGIPVFIDSRAEIYLDTFNDKKILEDWNNAKSSIEYKKIFQKYGVTHAIVYNSELLNIFLGEDDDWDLIYTDDTFSIYERKI